MTTERGGEAVVSGWVEDLAESVGTSRQVWFLAAQPGYSKLMNTMNMAVPRKRRPRSKRKSDWTDGLKKRTANALRAHGYTSREQVAATPLQQLMQVEHIGEASMADLVNWLYTCPAARRLVPLRPCCPAASKFPDAT